LSQRNEIALRLWSAYAEGNRPSIFAFGGLETVHGLPIRSVAGNRAAFANLQWRFPLIDRLDLAFMTLSEIRGRFFVDVGAAWYDLDGQQYNYLGQPGFQFMEDGRLKDGVAAYGFGVTVNLYGLPLNWEFSKRWDLKDTLGDQRTDFWIGFEF
jgi:outer membrane protein assembly factor BamA